MNAKLKKLLAADILLIPFMIGTIATGINLHIASKTGVYHQNVHAHIITAAITLILAGIHIYQHWGWYKTCLGRGKCKSTLFLTVLFAAVVMTGLIDTGCSPLSGVGLWHYRLSVLMTVFAMGHLIKRIPKLVKMIKAGRKQ